MQRNLSLRVELMLMLGGFVVIASASLGTIAYNTASSLIERLAVDEVGIAANARLQALNQLFDQQRFRAQAVVKSASLVCAPEELPCLRRAFSNFAAAEGARAVRVAYPSREPIAVSASSLNPVEWTAPTGFIGVRLHVDRPEQPYYLLATESATRDGSVQITLQSDIEEINAILLNRSELGNSGESFLMDEMGAFVTPPRYQVQSANPRPLPNPAARACLAGTDGEALDLDYRGVPAVHAYRHVHETGGCIVALIDQSEAFAPINELRRNVVAVSVGLAILAAALSLFLAQIVTRSIGRLRERARSLEKGDFDSPVPMGGPAEIQTFAQTFASMAASLKKSRTKLEETNEQIRDILEGIGDGFIAFDREWRCTYVNERAAAMFRMPPEEMIGRNLGQPFLDGVSPEARDHLLRSMKDRVPLHFEEYYAPWDGWFEVDAYPTPDGLAIFGRDVTGRKLMTERLQQTQKLESLGVLAGGIAHDFNNLLTGMMGNASLVLEDLPPDDPNRDALQDVVNAGERAALLTRQMLAYAGKGRFLVQKLDLSALAQSISSLLQTSIPRTVALRLTLPAGLPAVEADSSQIQQLIMNLVINAAEAIPDKQPGTVSVITGVEDVDQHTLQQATIAALDIGPGRYVTIEVRDTGSGMSESQIRRIFDPFYTTKFAGRGLGLAAATGIVRGHRGALKVQSAPDKGSTFKVYLPAVEGTAVSSQPPKPQKGLRGKGMILVIDDEESVRRAAQSILEGQGYTVLSAPDGQAGIALFRENEATSLVILDMTMPVMSGEQTLERLKAMRGGVPVILTSGYDETEAMGRFVGKGLAGFIQKPFTATSLAQQVAAALQT